MLNDSGCIHAKYLIPVVTSVYNVDCRLVEWTTDINLRCRIRLVILEQDADCLVCNRLLWSFLPVQCGSDDVKVLVVSCGVISCCYTRLEEALGSAYKGTDNTVNEQ